MERLELRTETRETRGKKVKLLRAQDWIPAVVYGPDVDPKPIQVEERVLFRTLKEAGSTTLIDLFVDDESKPYVVLAREIQRDILTSRLLHVDFYNLRLTERVKTTPRLEFVGDAPVLKGGEAVLIFSMNEIDVECLPTDLVNSITVDLSPLEKMDDNILVGDLPIPTDVTILADPGDVIVSVVPTRVALTEEEEALEAGLILEDEIEGEEMADEDAEADD